MPALLLSLLTLTPPLPAQEREEAIQKEKQPKPLDLENVSKKMSLWPDEVRVIREIRYRAGDDVRTIPPETTLEVISIQPRGIEIEHEGRRMLVRQQFVDLRPRVMEKIRRIATATELQRRRAAAQTATPGSGNTTGGTTANTATGTSAATTGDGLPSLTEIGSMPEDQRKAFLKQLSPQQQEALLQKIRAAKAAGQTAASSPPPPAAEAPRDTPRRPQPRIQSSALTDFVRKLSEDLLILNNNKLREYGELGFRDNEFFVLLVGTKYDQGTKALIPLIKRFYERTQVYRDNYEVVYIDRTRRHIEALNFIAEQNMPWPSVNPEKLEEHQELQPLLPRVSPAVILVDRQGQVISTTAPESGPTRRPEDVLKDLASVIDLPSGPSPGM
jgi:hypothetical protein